MVTTRRRFITPEDLAYFRFAGDPQISPDGARVLYTVKVVDGDKYSQHLWIDEAQYTLGKGIDALPRWSPDGRRVARAILMQLLAGGIDPRDPDALPTAPAAGPVRERKTSRRLRKT